EEFSRIGKVRNKRMEYLFHDLGILYADQGKLAEAEDLYNRCLKQKEETFGLKHPSTLNSFNNLGNVYKDQGKLTEAEAMFLRTLHGYVETVGPKHTCALTAVNNLGVVYTHQ